MTLQHEQLDAAVYRTVLPNGAVVLSERMSSVRSVAVGLWVRQGRVHERDAHSGVSHLLEHMVFKGTARRSPRELAWELERLGGALDAYTTHEATAFHARVPADDLDIALDVLCDLAFHPRLDDEDLEVEREVVLEEIASVEDVPEDVAFERHAGLLYDGHPYGEPILGSRTSVSSISVDALNDVHRSAYCPDNVVIVATGAVDHETLVNKLAAHLPEGRTGTTPEAVAAPAGTKGHERVTRDGARQTHIVTGALSVPYNDPLRYAIVVTSTALGGGMSSRLFQSVREELGLAYSVYSFHSFFAAGGHVGAYVGTRPEMATQARDALFEELSTVARDGLTQGELEDTRTQLKGQILISLESPTARMNRLAGVALYEQPYRTLDEVAARIDGVDLDQCREAAGFFDVEGLATLELTPAAHGATS